MFPLRDDNPTHRVPVLTIALIALNVLVFAYQSAKPNPAPGQRVTVAEYAASQTGFVCEFSVVPDRVLDGDAPADACLDLNAEQGRYTGLVTHQFIHADWLHLLGNMLFLWVFGNNIEDRLGRLRFLPFYLLCGILAALGQALTDPTSTIPLIGASGAISGVLGAYILAYPRAKVLTLVTVIPMRLPAWLVLGVYIAFQFMYVSGQAQEGAGGVAYWAHIVGFAAGMALLVPFQAGRPRHRPERRGAA